MWTTFKTSHFILAQISYIPSRIMSIFINQSKCSKIRQPWGTQWYIIFSIQEVEAGRLQIQNQPHMHKNLVLNLKK